MRSTTITMLLILIGMALLNPEYCEGYRILGIFALPASSHFAMFDALMKGLARKGHQVDVVSSFPQKKPYPNYTDIIRLPFVREPVVNNLSYKYLREAMLNAAYFGAVEIGNVYCENLGNPELLKLIRNPPKDPPYDLLLIEVCATNCFMVLGDILKVPMIGVSSSVLYPWSNKIIRNPVNLAFIPNTVSSLSKKMTFWQRVINTVQFVDADLSFQYYSTAVQNNLIKKFLGNDVPSISEAETKLALVLANSHPSINGPRPVTSALIEVGGLHVQDDGSELPRDLKEWMDKSTDGFIYFTFGSLMIIESFPEKLIRVFYKSLAKIAPINVLIKILDPDKLPPGMPKNFRTFKWTAQYKVFQHKNIKAFITHGGLMGTQEAIHCGIPMILLPQFVDQFYNAETYVNLKIAVKLNYEDITEEKMDTALNEILYNPVYKDTMRKVSAAFRDRPMSPMDTATWWIEYVMRHGNDVLRSGAMDLAWWQIELFDVYGFLILLAIFTIFVTIKLMKLLINLLLKTISPKTTQLKKNK